MLSAWVLTLYFNSKNGNTWYSTLPCSLTKLRLWQYLFLFSVFDSSVDFLWPLKKSRVYEVVWDIVLWIFCFKFEWSNTKILKYFLNWAHNFWGLYRAFLLALHVYWFPRATITNYCKLNGLKQQKFILSQFRSEEVWNQDTSRVSSFWSLWKSVLFLSSSSGGCQ